MVKFSIADQRLLGELISTQKRSFTLLLGTLEDKIRAAAEAGYNGVNFMQYDIDRYLGQGHVMKELVFLLDKYGLPLTEIGCTVEWHYTGDGRKKAIAEIRNTFSNASALKCGVVSVGLPPHEGNMKLAIRDFREICRIATAYGIKVSLEFFGFGTQIKDIRTSWIVLEEAGATNGGITLDTHHFHRGGSTLRDLEVFPVEKIFSVHLCDFPQQWTDPTDCWDRPLPGQGVAPVREVIDITKRKGYDDYWTLEVLNYNLWGKDPGEVARLGKRVMTDLFGS